MRDQEESFLETLTELGSTPPPKMYLYHYYFVLFLITLNKGSGVNLLVQFFTSKSRPDLLMRMSTLAPHVSMSHGAGDESIDLYTRIFICVT